MDPRRARAVLGVPPGAADADVERAFRHHARSAHPDHGGDAATFRELEEARRTLLQRRIPDRPLRVRRSLWQRTRNRLIELLPAFLLPRHLRRRGRRLG